MNRAAYAVLAAGAIVTAAASYQLKQLNRDIRQARLLYAQMEDDHSHLVKMVIQVSDRLAPPSKIAPRVFGIAWSDPDGMSPWIEAAGAWCCRGCGLEPGDGHPLDCPVVAAAPAPDTSSYEYEQINEGTDDE